MGRAAGLAAGGGHRHRGHRHVLPAGHRRQPADVPAARRPRRRKEEKETRGRPTRLGENGRMGELQVMKQLWWRFYRWEAKHILGGVLFNSFGNASVVTTMLARYVKLP